MDPKPKLESETTTEGWEPLPPETVARPHFLLATGMAWHDLHLLGFRDLVGDLPGRPRPLHRHSRRMDLRNTP